MSNRFGIPAEVELRIRLRDKKCVYCRKIMIYPFDHKKSNDSATIEHFREKGPFYWWDGLKEIDLAICCGECNSRRGIQELSIWFKTKYCMDRKINEQTVTDPVREYLRRLGR